MKNMTFRFFILLFISIVLSVSTFSSAEVAMESDSFALSVSVKDSAGESKMSPSFNLLDAAGQSTPIGKSESANYALQAGFIYNTVFSMLPDKALALVKDGLSALKGTMTKAEEKKIDQAIKFIDDALAAWALFEAGDSDALANALNKTRSAIKNMIDSELPETLPFQLMLAQTSELAVNAEINIIASTAVGGEANPNIIQARTFWSDGSTELLNADYFKSVQSFTKAYNEAIAA